MDRLLEIACFDHQSAWAAAAAGADRIELCASREADGLTALNECLIRTLERVRIPVHCMVRARAGNFIFSGEEKELMLRHAYWFRARKVQGVVCGALTEAHTIDENFCMELVSMMKPLRIIFHRAFDLCADPESAAETLLRLKFDGVLTSGGSHSAVDGTDRISSLQGRFGDKLEIIAGGGIRSYNVSEVLRSGCRTIHSSALTRNSAFPDPLQIRLMRQALGRGA